MSQIEVVQSLYDSGDYADAWAMYNAGGEGVEWELLGIKIAWAQRNLFTAKRIGEQALADYATSPTLPKLQIAAALVYAELGDYHLAHSLLLEVLANHDILPEMRAIALYNLGLVYYGRREYVESVEVNTQAARFCEALGLPDFYRKICQNTAWSLCVLGDAEAANEWLDRCEKYTTSGDARWRQTLGRAHIAAVEGGWKDVLELTADILEHGNGAADLLSHTAWLAGRAQLALGNVEYAKHLANGALTWACDAKDSRCMNDANALRVECCLRFRVMGV